MWFRRKQEPIFCRICGSRLAPDDRTMRFDDQTGKRIQPYLHNKVCHNKWCGLVTAEELDDR